MHGTFGLQELSATLKRSLLASTGSFFLIWHAWKTMLHQKAVAHLPIR